MKADSAIKLSKLKNTVAKASSTYRSGSLAMLWRARIRKGHGGWTGPLRVLLQEGSTVWLATGATLVRAKLNQLRPCTEREQLVVTTKELKSIRQLWDWTFYCVDTAEVLVEPSSREGKPEKDSWEARWDVDSQA